MTQRLSGKTRAPNSPFRLRVSTRRESRSSPPASTRRTPRCPLNRSSSSTRPNSPRSLGGRRDHQDLPSALFLQMDYQEPVDSQRKRDPLLISSTKKREEEEEEEQDDEEEENEKKPPHPKYRRRSLLISASPTSNDT